MTLTNASIFVIIDLILVITGSGYGLATLLPQFGTRLLGPFAPANIPDRSRRRLAVIRSAAFGLTFLAMGIAGLLRDLGGVPMDSVSRYDAPLLIVIGTLVGMVAHIQLNRR